MKEEEDEKYMSIDGLARCLHELHVDKLGDELVTAFKVTDLNGDGKVYRISPVLSVREYEVCKLFPILVLRDQPAPE
jgi:hypothetical protein